MKANDFKSLLQLAEQQQPKNYTLQRAICSSEHFGNDVVNFDDAVHDSDFPGISMFFRENGVDSFTVSSGWSGIVPFICYLLNDGWSALESVPVQVRTKLSEEDECNEMAVKFVRK